MIRNLITDLKTSVWYGLAVIALLTVFSYSAFTGTKFFPDGNIQKNAGYRGVVPHSGYGVRFYHK
ncbi:hypothetical protein KXD93_22120 [Mucilaginibacter sp. BJC16-A38]|uniref:hypothetical protein n=1 Tax=Mucilaginibacter phenanthrenivorans TaxID=1234842 RepID=UPI002157E9D7|nr:hypothetical protein [Mucilaginibacter phenanthrenivorans]MCR8560366.1 hypothetical protein [Mucilaginibacter phenanthrenivorans]